MASRNSRWEAWAIHLLTWALCNERTFRYFQLSCSSKHSVFWYGRSYVKYLGEYFCCRAGFPHEGNLHLESKRYTPLLRREEHRFKGAKHQTWFLGWYGFGSLFFGGGFMSTHWVRWHRGTFYFYKKHHTWVRMCCSVLVKPWQPLFPMGIPCTVYQWNLLMESIATKCH